MGKKFNMPKLTKFQGEVENFQTK